MPLRLKVCVPLLVTGLILSASLLSVGCTRAQPPAKRTTKPAATLPEGAPTKASPLLVDKAARRVSIYAEVNRVYVDEPTRHGIVFKGGSNGDKAVFRAWAEALDFYQALMDIGATPGNNVTVNSPKGTKVKGDELAVTVAWADKEYPFNDLIVSTGKLGGKPIVVRFGGNKELQSQKQTGCILCLDSCAAGITSNASVGWMSFDSGDVEFRGNGDLLPPDGTPVMITFALR